MPSPLTRSGTVESSAVASRTLDGVPLAHALVYIRNKRLSGVLELRASAERHAWLVLWRGLVVSSMTMPTVARFGTVVYELGFINATTLDETTVAAAKTKRTPMDILVERGTITIEERDQALVEQVRRRVHHLFTLLPSTTFTFREGSPSSASPSVAVDLLAPIWRGLCDFPPQARAAEVLARLDDHELRLVGNAVVERAELAPQEIALCKALAQKPMTLAQLRAASELPPERVDLLAYLLVITRCAEVVGATRVPLPSAAMWAATNAPRSRASTDAPGPSASRTSQPPPPTSMDRLTAAVHPRPPRGPAELGIAEIRRRAAGLATETPYGTLGLEEGASTEAARAAYFRLGRLWNPDRLPRELEKARFDVARIFAQMTHAHRRLTDPALAVRLALRNTARNGR